MKLKPLMAVILLVTLPSVPLASKKKEIILGFGAGYSLALDATLQEMEYDFSKIDEFYFKEQGRMKQRFSFNVQYFFNKRWGLQLEVIHQEASYFSHLEWYGKWFYSTEPEGTYYLEINHIEDPYWENWNLTSLTLSLLIAGRSYMNQRLYPYFSLGTGLYFLNADEELVLNRWRLGPKKRGGKFMIGGGFKYRLSSKLGLNLRIFAETIRRGVGGYREVLWVGLDQFDYQSYLDEGKIFRYGYGKVFVSTFTYGGIELSLEFKL